MPRHAIFEVVPERLKGSKVLASFVWLIKASGENISIRSQGPGNHLSGYECKTRGIKVIIARM
jgi:hypothetical protein